MIFKRKKSDGPPLKKPLWLQLGSYALGVVVLVMIGVAIYWSRMPDVFWVNEKLTNDVTPPSVFLDNIPSWELGVLQQVRDLARVIRNDYSRSQSQSREDPDVSVAEPKFFFDNDSWILPPSESEYRDAIKGFVKYRDRLATTDSEAQFFARADNLREWLAQVEKRLGSLTRRLGDSVASDVINTDLAGDAAAVANTTLSDQVPVRTSWFQIDDIFFEARGAAWALLHFFRAAEFDFADVLNDKNAVVSVRQIIRELCLPIIRW
jgi:hypothetical protein